MNTEVENLYARLQPELTPDEEGQLLAVSTHEAAHSLVAARLGLDSETLVVSASVGCCVHRGGTVTQNAIIGWAGAMAEVLLDVPHKCFSAPKTKLTNLTIHRWVDEIRLHELSADDRRNIEASSSKYHSADMCFAILSKNRETLEYLARSLADRSREAFRQNKDMPAILNERKLEKFYREQEEKQVAKAQKENLQQAIADSECILANLPPCKIPTEFTYETFLTCTKSSGQEIRQYLTWKITCARQQLGMDLPSKQRVADEIAFFRTLNSRGDWIAEVRKLYQFRAEQKGIKNETVHHQS